MSTESTNDLIDRVRNGRSVARMIILEFNDENEPPEVITEAKTTAKKDSGLQPESTVEPKAETDNGPPDPMIFGTRAKAQRAAYQSIRNRFPRPANAVEVYMEQDDDPVEDDYRCEQVAQWVRRMKPTLQREGWTVGIDDKTDEGGKMFVFLKRKA